MRLLVPALFLLAACATPSGAAKSASAAPSPSSVVAHFGSRDITLGEVDARAGEELTKLTDQIYELRTETAERIALEAIVDEQAKKEGITEEKWLEARVETGLQEPSEADLQGLFEKVRERLPPGASYEDVKPQLRTVLQREARGNRARELFRELLKHAGYTVVLPEPVKPKKVVDATGPAKGPAVAPVTIVAFSDFQCPYCSRAARIEESVLAAYPGKVRFVFRHFPLSFHDKAPYAAEAGACADEQGKFWAFHDTTFENQSDLEPSDVQRYAEKSGVDLPKWLECMRSGRAKKLVAVDLEAGKKAGVTGTPAYFINGTLLSGAQPEDAFKKVIDKELEKSGGAAAKP